ncbi:MAG: hypothetical protein RR659_04795 [Bacilli bacterium]
MKNKIKLLATCSFVILCPMMLGSVFALSSGTIQYIKWILYWTGNVSLVVSIVASFGVGASVAGAIYAYVKKKGVTWLAAW